MRKTASTVIVVSIIMAILSGAALGYLVGSTTPKQLGPVGVTIWFILLWVFLASILTLIGFLWKMRKQVNREKVAANFKESLRLALLLSFCTTLLLGLMSLKSLTIRDMILFILTVVLIELYFRTRKSEV